MLASYRQIKVAVAQGYDIVHVHTPIASFLARLAVRRIPAPRRPRIVYTAHGFHFHARGSTLTNGAFIVAERLAGRWTDRLVVINGEDYAAARRYGLVPEARLVHMTGIGIDTEWFARSSLEVDDLLLARANLGIDADAPMFVVVAELSRRKRPLDVVAALAMMRDTGAHVVFLGDGPERHAVETAVRGSGLSGRVHLEGFVSDVRVMVGAATALVLASSREGLPRSIMEALSLEVPVIATDARGNAELVLPDGGFIVPIGDVTSLAIAMDEIAARPDQREALGKAGRRRMVERYDIRLLLERHQELYAELVRDHATREQT